MTENKNHGGKRKNSGRKPEGKKRYNLTLTEENAEAAKAKSGNFSGLVDQLIAEWLKK